MVVSSKEVKLTFKDKDGVRLAGSSITVESGMSWQDIEKLLAEFIKQYTGKDERVSAAIICGQWTKPTGFPNGTHFFINWDNEWGFTSAYLFRETA